MGEGLADGGRPRHPLKKLGSAVREWIMSFFAEQHHPVMPTYALDAACFVAAHGEGTCLSSDRSPPAVLPQMVDGDFWINCIGDRGFRMTLPKGCSATGSLSPKFPKVELSSRPEERFGPGRVSLSDYSLLPQRVKE